ncbi:hypothetical protein R1flu_007065 [Riccia fluitans]|uniref:Uncharacterized protein n=1 Tax=Riccia fluitans TaxID=41844 RepID=A0ABD1YYD8_9MARC
MVLIIGVACSDTRSTGQPLAIVVGTRSSLVGLPIVRGTCLIANFLGLDIGISVLSGLSLDFLVLNSLLQNITGDSSSDDSSSSSSYRSSTC